MVQESSRAFSIRFPIEFQLKYKENGPRELQRAFSFGFLIES